MGEPLWGGTSASLGLFVNRKYLKKLEIGHVSTRALDNKKNKTKMGFKVSKQ